MVPVFYQNVKRLPIIFIHGGLITLFSLTFLAGGIIITASHRLFGLITWIPDNVMKWIGHSPHSLGEQDAESKIRNSFGGFTSTMQNALNPRMTAGFRGKPGGGDKDQTDKTAALAAAQATATEQATSQAKGGVPGQDGVEKA